MKVNTAVCFILIGIAYGCLQAGRSQKPWSRLVAALCSCVILLIGLGTMGEYVFHGDLGIDQLFLKSHDGFVWTVSFGRMALPVAIGFVALALVFLFLSYKKMRVLDPRLDLEDDQRSLSTASPSMKRTRALIESLKRESDDHKRAEEALRENEKRFVEGMCSSRDAIFLMGDGQFVDCNDAVVRMFGYASREEILKHNLADLSPATQPDGRDSLEKAREMIRLAVEQGFHRFEWLHRKAEGEEFPAQVTLTPSVMRGRRILSCVLIDLTQQKQNEQRLAEIQLSLRKHTEQLAASLEEAVKSRQILSSMLEDNNQIRADLEERLGELKRSQNMLIQSEKLASLGRLVSEIAHEVSNPLMIISGNAQLSLMSETISDEEKKSMEIIVNECQRAKNVIRRVLRFAKPSHGDIKEVEIAASLEAIVGILEKQFLLTHNIEIKRKYLEQPVHVFVDEGQLQEVFMNLLNNAKEAMEHGGVITITTSLDGAMLRVDFKDTGPGMSDEVLRKLMEPFFTTKETGTGIGLSVCYGILKAHNGELRFESELGKGTTATIMLPLKGEA